MEKSFTDSGLQEQNGRESFHEGVQSTLRFYHFNLHFISITFKYFKTGDEMMPRLLL